jgi:hypothetical protein
MSVIPAERDLTALALSKLPAVFRNKTNWTKILTIFAAPFQEVYDALLQLQDERDLDNSVGEQLDILGAILNKRRLGADDDTYRIRLRAQIRLIKSSGTQPELLELLDTLLDGSYLFTPYYPASFVIEAVPALTASQASEFGAIIQAGKAAGVRGFLVYSLEDDDATFQLASGDAFETDADTGLSNDAQTTGGALADVA